MSRKKNAVVANPKIGESKLNGLSMRQNVAMEHLARKSNTTRRHRECQFGHCTALVMIKENSAIRRLTIRHTSKYFPKNRDIVWNYIESNYKKSWTHHDGTFFRKLAYAVEHNQNPASPARAWFTGKVWDCKVRGIPMPTFLRELRVTDDEEAGG